MRAREEQNAAGSGRAAFSWRWGKPTTAVAQAPDAEPIPLPVTAVRAAFTPRSLLRPDETDIQPAYVRLR
ncbi:MAG TPA: hypothetical protein VMW64_02335 [Dehalococcoidia bacterium]|nr:hypothetical protein [Dehalococcoidia bacterium]